MSKGPTEPLLCFYGTGSKGAIFHVQMARICFLSKDAFEFIFLDGPLEGPAGPGVLTMFSGQAPYYCCFGGHDHTIEESMGRINETVKQAVDEWKAINLNPDAETVGVWVL